MANNGEAEAPENPRCNGRILTANQNTAGAFLPPSLPPSLPPIPHTRTSNVDGMNRESTYRNMRSAHLDWGSSIQSTE